jgi:hypothetical protein
VEEHAYELVRDIGLSSGCRLAEIDYGFPPFLSS